MKKVLMGFVLGCIVTATTGVLASNQTVSAILSDISFDFGNGSVQQQALTYNDTTYVPARFLSEQLGKKVNWDSESGKIYVGIPIPPKQQTTNYTLDDAFQELGLRQGELPTVQFRDLAIELLQVRKNGSNQNYKVSDALRDLGVPSDSIPTLTTFKQAIDLIKTNQQ